MNKIIKDLVSGIAIDIEMAMSCDTAYLDDAKLKIAELDAELDRIESEKTSEDANMFDESVDAIFSLIDDIREYVYETEAGNGYFVLSEKTAHDKIKQFAERYYQSRMEEEKDTVRFEKRSPVLTDVDK